jgi:hypothetical protein
VGGRPGATRLQRPWAIMQDNAGTAEEEGNRYRGRVSNSPQVYGMARPLYPDSVG